MYPAPDMITQERQFGYSSGVPRRLAAMSSGSGWAVRQAWRADRVDLMGWVLLLVAAVAASWILGHGATRLGVADVPVPGRHATRLDGWALLAPAVAGLVLLGANHPARARIGWRPLLLLSAVAATAWTLALALFAGPAGLGEPLRVPMEHLAQMQRAGQPLLPSLRPGADDAPTPVTLPGYPPVPLLALWWGYRLGLTSPVAAGAVLVVLAATTVPLVLVAVRSLCGTAAARRLAPVLVLAPYAVWVAGSVDGVTAAIGAAAIAAAAIGSEHRQRWWFNAAWGAASGLLLGVAALLSYSTPWLALSILCVYFVRRRPLLNLVTAAAALLPLLAGELAGLSWPAGLAAAVTDAAGQLALHRDAVAWALLAVVVLLLAGGPALVRSGRRLRNTPGWPYLAGATAGVAFAVLAAVAHGAMGRGWLPFLPWLLVAAVAPERRAGSPAATPIWLAAAGAVVGIGLDVILTTG